MYLRQVFEMSERRACRVIGSDRTSVRYQGVRPDDEGLPPVWAAFRGSAGSGTVLFCGSGDEKCPQVQLWAQVRENGGDTGRGQKR